MADSVRFGADPSSNNNMGECDQECGYDDDENQNGGNSRAFHGERMVHDGKILFF